MGEDAGTLRFDSAPVTGETETRILPTGEGLSRPAAATTVLDDQRALRGTRDLGKPKSRKRVIIAVGAIIALTLAASAYYYLSRDKNTTTIESIAVLPFVNESGSADVEYLSDGMTETLIGSLSQIPKLNVKARSSVFRYKGKDTNAQTIGRDLNVQAILTGRVMQRGQDLILYVELVDAATENVLWKADYNRPMTNLVSLQGEVARDVSQKLRTRLSGAEERRVAKTYTENTEAYQLYLKGRHTLYRGDEDSYKRSIDYYQRAIAIDPNYALAYAGIAEAYSFAGDWYLSNLEAMPKAEAAAMKALELEDTLAEAHVTMGNVREDYDWNWSESDKEYRRAIELNPNYSDAHRYYSSYLGVVRGRHSEAIGHARQAVQLDPLSLAANINLANAFFIARQYDDAIEQLRRTLELEPDFWATHQWLGEVYEQKGQFPEAIAALQKARQSGVNPLVLGKLGRAFARSGNRAEAQKLIGELTELSKQHYVSSTLVAEIYASLGERDRAFEWLEKGYEERSSGMLYLKTDPLWDDFRSDPKFAELMRKVGLPQ
jgi:TolB-like protein/Tfp pilus assembly protein PilF